MEIKEKILQAVENQDYPFEDLVEQLALKRNVSRNPLFDVMFSFIDSDAGDEKKAAAMNANLNIQPYTYENRTAKFDLTLYGIGTREGLFFTFEYRTKLFKANTIERFSRYFKKVLSTIIKNPGVKIVDIQLISSEEKQQLIYDFNDTTVDYPRDKTLDQLFGEQVERVPDPTAVVGPLPVEYQPHTSYRSYISYKELDDRSNQLAHLLKEKGVVTGSVVGIMPDRSIEMIVGILAILKAGGAYLPIDPEYPEERIDYMLKDSGASILLTEEKGITESPFSYPSTLLPLYSSTLPSLSTSTSTCRVSSANPAYVIYTSGSTGNPRGVVIENRTVVNFIKGITDVITFSENDYILSLTTLSFDIFVLETILPLIKGSRVFIGSREQQLNVEAAASVIAGEKISIFQATPSRVQLFIYESRVSQCLKRLKYLLVGGEAFPMELLKKTREITTGEIYNLYGPTETTIWSTIKNVSHNESLNIGKPIANTRVYILNKSGYIQPLGVPGELCIAGAGVARGYLNNPELTSEKFDHNLWDYQDYHDGNHRSNRSYKSDVLYKTGDLARWLSDGNIEFLGRMDFQVKIRGFRVELQEIENHLRSHIKVKEAVVIVKKDETSEKYLCAIIRGTEGNMPQVGELREFLSQKVPGYMIPSYFVEIEEMPLTPNGKADRKALAGYVGNPLRTGTTYVAPETRTEKILACIWKDLLGIEAVGIYDNFFELGGDSLKAITVSGRIQQETNTEILLSEFFNRPTVKELAEYINKKNKDENERSIFTSLKPVEKKAYYRLSPAQNRLYILNRLDPASLGYNLPITIILEGKIEREKLAEIFRELIRRHESFSTFFEMLEGEPVQRILPSQEIEFVIEYDEVKALEEGESDTRDRRREKEGQRAAVKKIIREFVRPFNLDQAPLMRAALIKLSTEKYIFVVDIHHIINDGTSQAIFFKEFEALAAGKVLPEFNIQYKDYAEWQNNSSYKKVLKSQERYWTREFTSEPPVLQLPTDYNRPAVQSFEGAVLDFELDKKDTKALKALARDENATLYMILLSLFYILLAKISSQDDIVLGTPVVGRKHPDLHHIIGIFINSLALRNYPLGEKTFIQFLQEINDKSLEAFDNQDYPFEDLVEQVAVSRDLSRNPFFDVMFILHNELSLRTEAVLGKNDRNLKFEPYEKSSTVLDLTLVGFDAGDYLPLKFEYATKLFKQGTIERFINYFKNIISSIRRNPYVKISDVKIVTEEEKQQILVDFNDTAVDYPRDKTINQLFEEQVEQTPDRVVLVAQSEGNKAQDIERNKERHAPFTMRCAFTYRELNNQSNRLAHILTGKGVKTDIIVGIMVGRSIEMIIGILGILKAGGAYLPIDPAYPQERISYMLADSSARIFLKKSEIRNPKSETNTDEPDSNDQNKGAEVTVLDFEHLNFEFVSDFGFRASNFLSSSLAYVIYTSGSTGRPKGVMIEHRAVHNFIEAMTGLIDFKPGEIILALTTITFDIFGLETLLPLCRGLKVVLADENHQLEMGLLEQLVVKNCVGMIQATPGRMQMFTMSGSGRACLGNLKELMVGGEALPIQLLTDLKLSTPAKIYNMYGPTETTIWSTVKDLTGAEEINIGTPIQNTVIYILDKHYHLQPVGVPGELCISGDGLARGYLNRPQLTADRFYRSYRSHTPYIIYKTGDLARWQSDGNIEFLGRMDHQVKIRGFRIELGEIENQLLTHKKIKEAIVIARENNNDKYLCAYLVAKPGETNSIDHSGLREYLSNRLPDYMVPAYLVQLDNIPLTPNGKIDRKALPDQVFAAGQDYTAPRNKIEKELVDIWAEVLGRDPLHVSQLRQSIGINNNFFQLGGHSLKATILIARIHKKYHIQIPLVEFFKTPTIKQLAGYMNGSGPVQFVSIEPVEKKEYYPLTAMQKRLYFLQQIDLMSTAYNLSQFAVLEGDLEKNQWEETFKELLQRHEGLRTSFKMFEGEFIQLIHEKVEFEIQYLSRKKAQKITKKEYNHTGRYSRSQEQGVEDCINQFLRPFELSHPPLLRVGLLELGKFRHLLMVDIHHIITDGISQTILIQNFMDLYSGKELPSLQLQYKDFSQWQNNEKQKKAIKNQQEFWVKQFQEEIPILNTPTDYPRPAKRSFEGSTVSFEINEKETSALYHLALEKEVTLYMLLIAIINILLSKVSGQEDIVIGTPIANRIHSDIEQIIGLFVNTIALRNNPTGDKTFTLFLEDVKKRTLNCFANQDYPFEELVENLSIKRDLSRNPLFDVMFFFQNMAPVYLEIPKLRLITYDFPGKTARFDFIWTALEIDKKIHFVVEYSTILFKKETIERFIGYFKQIVLTVIKMPEIKLSGTDILSVEEKRRLMNGFNRTEQAYPGDNNAHELFEVQAERTPDHTILVGQIPNKAAPPAYYEISITYRELDNRSNQLAYYLKEKGVQTDTIVGLMVERSVEILVTLLGILKAGGAYLPIDADYPEERIRYMLSDSGARILLTTEYTEREFINNIPVSPVNIVFTPVPQAFKIPLKDTALRSFSAPVPPMVPPMAYVIYTSGSTGNPKGVMIEHRSLMNFTVGMTHIIDFQSRDKVLSLTTISFDIFGLESLVPLAVGTAVVIGSREEQLDVEAAVKNIRRQQVTILQVTPSRLAVLISATSSTAALKSLKYLLVGGEALPGYLLEKARIITRGKIYNLYGPTETTIWSTAKDLTGRAPLDIGKPIANTLVFLLDRYLELVPIGAAGELYIGGDGLARGYLNRPGLTNDKFLIVNDKIKIKNEIKRAPGRKRQKIYRTGDLARWLWNGNIEFLGRIDHQVKIRGFRVEPSEIKKMLVQHPDITEAVVTSRKSFSITNIGKEYKPYSLWAYFVAEKDFSVPDLREYLAARLPGYMIPTYFVKLKSIPLTHSGKIDWKALDANGVKLGTGFEYSAPTSDIEKIIAQTWKEVLHVDRLGVNDNFFDLGGNSLKVMELSSKLSKVLKKEIPVIRLFEHSTIKALAAYLKEEYGTKNIIKTAVREKIARKNAEYNHSKEIAIIGISCRFPGAKNIEEFWNNLKEGKETISFFLDEELLNAGVDPGLLNNPNFVNAASIISNKEFFDAHFFSYTPTEAELLDPQIRIFHECSWEAFEDSGIVPEFYDGLIGVYAGASQNLGWEARASLSGRSSSFGEYAASQLTGIRYLCMRLSYNLNLKGPSIAVQTTCSTSLAAIHMACQALLKGECDIALAGGVTVSSEKKSGYLYEEGMILSPDGHCRALDANAKGTIFGEGAGAVILKPVEDSIADGDNIYAVIKGSAVNNDGNRKIGFTAPSVAGQAAVIRSAFHHAGIETESISYIEVHGTGTPIGDPIEVEALTQAFNTNKKKFCKIGSVKSNIGHLDSASGAAGFIKTVLALKNRMIPPTLHFESSNPAINPDDSPFEVNTRLTEWKTDKYPLRAGVSSMGMGGTNVHVILEEAPEKEKSSASRNWHPIVISAKSENSINMAAKNLADFLRKNNDVDLADVAYTLQTGRKRFNHRRMITCSNLDEAIGILSMQTDTFVSKDDNRSVVFMFPGQGAQYVNMGLELYQTEAVFQEEMNRCFDLLKAIMEYDIKRILYPGEDSLRELSPLPDINQTNITQPLMFVFEYALAKLLMSWGVQPNTMIGHSSGEYAAACLAGVFPLEDALKLVVLRGQLMHKMPPGSMLSISAPVNEIKSLLNEELALAAINSSSLCVISGRDKEIENFSRKIKEKGYECRKLKTSHAFHSKMMDPIIEEFEQEVETIHFNNPGIPYISNVTGDWLSGEEVRNPQYWSGHLRRTVRFADGLEKLLTKTNSILIEIGPGNTLCKFARTHCKKTNDHIIINPVRHPRESVSDVYYLLDKVGKLWLYGQEIDWSSFYSNEKRYRISLPTYAFDRQYYWIDDIDLRSLNKNTPATKTQDISDWFYIPLWKRSVLLPENKIKPESGYNLLFPGTCDLNTGILNKFEQNSEKTIEISIGSRYEEISELSYTIRPEVEEDYEKLFSKLVDANQIPKRIIHMWTVSDKKHRSLSIERTREIQNIGFYSLLNIARAIGNLMPYNRIEIFVITNNMQDVNGMEEIVPEKSTILGAVHVIPQEYNNISCCSIDIDLPGDDKLKRDTLLNDLYDEFTHKSPGNIIAYRGTHRWIHVLEPAKLSRLHEIPLVLKPNGIYLITGGLGGMGLVLAEFLSKAVKPKLILTGRSDLPEKKEWSHWLEQHEPEDITSKKIKMLKTIEENGSEIFYLKVDVSKQMEMREKIKEVEENVGEINGIIHAAGIADNAGIIHRRDRKENEKIFLPKLTGTLVLNNILEERNLDFFVLCSSINSLCGDFGQVGFSAANAFLDAFARYKKKNNNILAIGINWDLWLKVGMFKKLSERNGEERQAITGGILPEEGVEVFARSIDHHFPNLAVSTIDFEARRQRFHVNKIICGDEESKTGLSTIYAASQPKDISFKSLNEFEDKLLGIWQELLGYENIGVDDNFFELGGDSLTAAAVRKKVKEVFNIDIPLVKIFHHPTIRSFAKCLLKGDEPTDKESNSFQQEEDLVDILEKF
jgi:amino acid adenylation domain-containing protein